MTFDFGSLNWLKSCRTSKLRQLNRWGHGSHVIYHMENPPPCELTDTTENTTFPHTTYAGGNNNSEYVQAEFLPLTPNGFHSPCKREWVRKIRSSTRNSQKNNFGKSSLCKVYFKKQFSNTYLCQSVDMALVSGTNVAEDLNSHHSLQHHKHAKLSAKWSINLLSPTKNKSSYNI